MTLKALANVLAFTLVAGAAHAQTAENTPAPVDTSIFPAAKKGMVQHILTVPAEEHEENFITEIVVGRMMEVDCNKVVIGADLEREDLEGWGYNYFEVEDISEPASTMMGCPDNTRTEKFVSFNFGNDAFQRYNSRMPLVIYAPEGVTVGYRIWSTDGELHQNAPAAN
ncbi:serine protease inhibitor ecotin [Xinfangfangia sp. CPCC 101601]|uniref:Serine protease inhibitor ecotin n=1 Tax=Pseudogemmobacter lacusdianii TaxID=3069608 RepID=A0ABU0W0Y9_9RHOB|nr:serine protease inhibitor ecotin [Xinfangfangia sp. CPCC 101601]MDQ2067681.1 serine protease inhibitor ecotin [Xinfangfangia sp. CPCC 101601]